MSVVRWWALLSLLACAAVACKSSQNLPAQSTAAVAAAAGEEDTLELFADTMTIGLDTAQTPVWLPQEGPFQPSRTRVNDLLHVSLRVRFDWPSRTMPGQATLRLTPYFYPTDSLVLDAKYMRINRVALVSGTGMRDLAWTYPDSMHLRIRLDRQYKRGEQYQVFVDYVAQPEHGAKGGSEAISGDKGLYFINHDGKTPGKPRQIWTQGETEATSRWAPVIDAPNERCTNEIFLTVADSFRTLSNGALVSSKRNPDGTRTDHWRMDKPHAPYLFMMAVGNFRVVNDKWRNVPLMYYLEPDYAPHARTIFGETPQMVELYSRLLGVDYPWNKYAQVVVRDFVSGAMENTTATVHYEPVQHDARAHLDETHEDIIAHELFHQWFGDYVTTESWANLPLNESFATYGEYLWYEHRHGRAAADHHLEQDLDNYLNEAEEKRWPLIRYHYQDKEDMFDRHSYQKGGRVLHMLRHVVGDEAFFASLQHYLKTNALSAVEVAELRMAFEDVTGQDLMWFFDQWFLQRGHPELEVRYETSATEVQVHVRQTQNLRYQPLFRLPAVVEIALPGGQTRREAVELRTADTTFRFQVNAQPEYVDFDADKVLLAAYDEEKPQTAWLAQLRRGKAYQQRANALRHLADSLEQDEVRAALLAATQDTFWALRQQALQLLLQAQDAATNPAFVNRVMHLAVNDPKAAVRAEAVSALTNLAQAAAEAGNPIPRERLREVFVHAAADSSYKTAGAGILGLSLVDEEAGLAAANANRHLRDPSIRQNVGIALMRSGAPDAQDYVERAIDQMPGATLESYTLIQTYGQFLAARLQGEAQQRGVRYLMNLAKNAEEWISRLGAVRGLAPMAEANPEIQALFEDLKQNEPNEQLRELYRQQL